MIVARCDDGMVKMSKKADIKKWADRIQEAIDTDGPYSHNIISMALGAVAKAYGKEEANKLIEKFDLEGLGWEKE